MSLVDELGTVAGAAAGNPLSWIRIGWKAFPWLLCAALAIALGLTRETLAGIRADTKLAAVEAQLASARHDLAQAGRTNTAVSAFADKAAALKPIVVRSTKEVELYAQTPAGRAPCAAPDRVLRIDRLDQALFPAAAPAGAGARALPADTGAPPAGRLGEQR